MTKTSCKCGCGFDSLSDRLVLLFSALGSIDSIKVSSCCRCKAYNGLVGGSKSSSHMADRFGNCNAVDIVYDDAVELFDLVSRAMSSVVLMQCIVYPRKKFVHFDVLDYPGRVKKFLLEV